MKNHTMSGKAQIEESTFKDRGFELEQGISNRVVEIRCIVRDVNRTEFLEVMKGYFSPLIPSSSKEKIDEIKRLVVELKKAKNLSCTCSGFGIQRDGCGCGRSAKLILAKTNLENYLENL